MSEHVFTALSTALDFSNPDRVGYSLNHCQRMGLMDRVKPQELRKVCDVMHQCLLDSVSLETISLWLSKCCAIIWYVMYICFRLRR